MESRIKPECCQHSIIFSRSSVTHFPHSQRGYCSENIFCMEKASQWEVRVIYLDVFHCGDLSSILSRTTRREAIESGPLYAYW